MQAYSTDPSRNSTRAAGRGAGSSAEIPGKVAEPIVPNSTKAMEAHPAQPGSGVRGFTGGGLVNPFVKGEKMGTDAGAED